MWHLQDDWSEVTFKCYEYSVRALAISSDDKYLISGGNDENTRVWNLHDNTQEAVLRARSDITVVAMTSDNKYILSGDRSGCITIWNFQLKKVEEILNHHSDKILSLKITSDNKYVISYANDSRFILWNIKMKRSEFVRSFCPISSLAASNDKEFIIYGTYCSFLYLYNIRENGKEFKLAGHHCSVKRLTRTSDNKYIVSISDDSTMRIWSAFKKKEKSVLSHYDVNTLAISLNDKYIVSGCLSGFVKVWKIKASIKKSNF